jgi:hypothetical protein
VAKEQEMIAGISLACHIYAQRPGIDVLAISDILKEMDIDYSPAYLLTLPRFFAIDIRKGEKHGFRQNPRN